MDKTQTTCPHCGKPVAANLMGLCPQCMLKAGMATQSVGPAGGERFVPPTVEELGRHFPALEILELIGRGGMGAVYKARQKSLDRVVALKILPPLAENAETTNAESKKEETAFAERFAREAKALAAMSHPNIVTLYEFGEAEGLYFFLMEYVDGVDLRQLMAAGKLAPKEALAIVPHVCDALQYAHDRGIVHRDIKPENILIGRDGVVKIADFGVAKIVGGSDAQAERPSDEGAQVTDARVVGTPAYMAPEQKDRPGEVDHRADIYSLGVVFYQMLTGELPGKQIEAPSRKVQIDVRLDEVVLRALEREPELRYSQASVFKTAVETIAEEKVESRTQKAGIDAGLPLAYGVEPRFSRAAIVGAAWVVLFFAVVPAFLAHEYQTHEFWTHGPLASPLVAVLSFGILLPALIAPIGSTLVGWIAVTQIRRSSGRLYGMWLAVFDGLIFPLLALDVLFFFVWEVVVALVCLLRMKESAITTPVFADHLVWACVIILTVLSSAIIDYWIIRRVWRAVSKTEADTILPGRAEIQEPESRKSGEQPMHAVRFSKVVIAGVVWMILGLIGILVVGNITASVPWLMVVVLVVAAGTTLLGWIATGQIRRSAGQVGGMKLALFARLLFPLLALDALIFWAWATVVRIFTDFYANLSPTPVGLHVSLPLQAEIANVLKEHYGLTILGALVTAILADYFIIRRVWQSVNKTETDPGSPVESGTYFGTGRQLLLALGGALLMACIAFAVWRVAFHTPPAGLPSSPWVQRAAPSATGSIRSDAASKTPDRTADVALLPESGLPNQKQLLEQLHSAQARAAELRSTHGASHPSVMQAEQTIKALESEIRRESELPASRPAIIPVAPATAPVLTESPELKALRKQKLEMAEVQLRQAEGRFKAGLVSAVEPLVARRDRDLAAAELEGDRAKIAQVQVTYAEKMVGLKRKMYDAGFVDHKEYQDAVMELTRAKVEYERTKAALAAPPGATTATQPAAGNPFVKRLRFEPQADMAEKTNWSVMDKPSIFNREGWAIVANMAVGGVVPARLPGETKEFCRIKMVDGNDDQITLQVEDVAKGNTMTVRINRDQYAEITVNGDRYRIVYPAVSVNLNEAESTPLALVIVTHADQKQAATSQPQGR